MSHLFVERTDSGGHAPSIHIVLRGTSDLVPPGFRVVEGAAFSVIPDTGGYAVQCVLGGNLEEASWVHISTDRAIAERVARLFQDFVDTFDFAALVASRQPAGSRRSVGLPDLTPEQQTKRFLRVAGIPPVLPDEVPGFSGGEPSEARWGAWLWSLEQCLENLDRGLTTGDFAETELQRLFGRGDEPADVIDQIVEGTLEPDMGDEAG